MRTIRWIEDQEREPYLRLLRDAYAGVSFPPFEEHLEVMSERASAPGTHLGAVFDGPEMVGAFRLHDFRMNVFGAQLPAWGIGGVATAVAHRGRHVARDLMRWYLDHALAQGAALATLYPFRPSFYVRMGFGAGAPMHRYRLRPESLPRSEAAAGMRVRLLGEEHLAELVQLYDRKQARTHGLFAASGDLRFRMALENGLRIAGQLDDSGRIHGYLIFTYRVVPDRNAHDLVVEEWLAEDTGALRALLGFLREQRDQVQRVELLTQDDWLHHLLTDPLDGSEQLFHISHQMNVRGWGIMYRVLHAARLFEQLAEHDFGGVDLVLGLALEDDFVGTNGGRVRIAFRGGRPRVLPAAGGADVELSLGVADFSSLVLGAVPLERLLRYGLAEVSESDLEPTLQRLFASPEKPICMTRF